jgi:O-antigen/teichoic acid export membrane protein
VGKHAAPTRAQVLGSALHRPGMGRSVARTAGFNVASNVFAALGGVILARAVDPTVRGEYAAVTAWFGVALVVGSLGQPAALCFYVARSPQRAREYVATSRAMMLVTGALAIAAGLLLAPVLAHGNPGLTAAYRIVFGGSLLAYVGASYTFSLQARDIDRWNALRLSQPVLGCLALCALWALRLLTLDAALLAMLGSMLVQLGWAHHCCRRAGLAPGTARISLVRPLAGYGVAQIASVAPATLNAQLDQLILSQIVVAADLARYSIAVSITLLPVPFVAAIGYVAFPRLAAQRVVSDRSLRMQRLAVLASAGVAAGMLLPIAASAYWVVPLVFGPAYRGAVPLIWILTPGGIFLACGQVVGDLLRGMNRPNFVAGSQWLAAIFTVVLLYALLPSCGVAGAAIASTIAYGVALAAMVRCLWRMQVAKKDRADISVPADGLVQRA